jgi:GT2 family glycosyltransferase
VSVSVSVVIPCRNEVRAIEATVRALLAGKIQDIEVLVIDGMSEDGTREIMRRLEAEDPRVRMIDNPKRLTPFAFNLGVQHARGEHVQIVGSRNVLASDYIATLRQALAAHPEVACVGGDYQHVYDNPSGRWISLAMESRFGVGGSNYRVQTQDAFVDTVGIPLYRRSIFSQVGMFDETLTRNQDDEFNFRVRAKGYKIMYVHAAKATYLVRGSLTKACHQFSQYGYFKVFVSQKHRRLTTVRQLVPALFLFALVFLGSGALFSYGLSWTGVSSYGRELSFFFAICLVALILVYGSLGLYLAGSKLSMSERLRVLRACFTLHVGYGFGYLLGIWDFLVLRRMPRASFQSQTT